MPTKTCAVLVKATAADDPTLEDGQFTALASVFNNIDAVGDVVMPGAFAEDLKAWKASGDPIPLLWGHQMQDPDFNLGGILEAAETDVGLRIKAQLDLDNPKAVQVYRLLKGKRVRKMSFAYDVQDAAPAERDGESVYELRKLKLHEISVVQIPANPAATIQAVKDAAERRKAQLKDASVTPITINVNAADTDPAEVGRQAVAAIEAWQKRNVNRLADPVEPKTATPDSKAGRTLSAKNESTLRSALDQINAGMADVKSVLDSLDSNDGKANPAQPATAEEPHGVKTDSPAPPGPASSRLRTAIDQIAVDVLTHSED